MSEIGIVLKELHQRPISFFPIYSRLMGSVTGGVALSQIIYWFTAGNNPPLKIYKTDKELQEETTLSTSEMRAVKKKLKELDFLTITRENIPAKTFYEIHWNKLFSSLVKFTKLEDENTSLVNLTNQEYNDISLVKFTELDRINSLNSDSEINGTITETTQRLPKSTSLVTTKVDNNNIKSIPKSLIEAKEVSEYLADKLSKSIDTYKKPSESTLKSWTKDIERAIRLDGRTKQQLKSIIRWVHDEEGTFWIPNIKSGKKLRQQFDTLWFQMNSSKPKISIKERALSEFGIGNVFFKFKSTTTNREIHICLFGNYHALYDYRGDKYIDKLQAEKVWKHIENNFDTILEAYKKDKE